MRVVLWLGWCGLLLAVSPIGSVGDDAVSQESKSERAGQKGDGGRSTPKPTTAPPRPAATKPTERMPAATPVEMLKVKKDYKVELLYSVPKNQEGSWVNLCVDPKGRLIASDQFGPLYRITPSRPTALSSRESGSGGGGNLEATKVEALDLPLGGAHGLLWAFDSLYVMVNEGVSINDVRPRPGLHRVRSNDGGDTFERPEFLHDVPGRGEHGSHAMLPAPDGKSLYVVCGNQTRLVRPLAGSRVPRIWGEDHLLPRLPDGNGFMRGVLGPGGCIYQVDPDGKNWELISTGYRNPFDIAFNRDGELFTYDADMEWDMNTPWYRPTRVCLATSGSEFGWRNGAGKWPAYYPDSLPAVFNVGPGSPTGVASATAPASRPKYQEALFLCDWSYGNLYALHLTPDGSAYKGEVEEFLSGSPLPLTDVVVNPKDGALYFTVGGRQTQSGLYRVTYTGNQSTAPAKAAVAGAEARALRHRSGGVPRARGSEGGGRRPGRTWATRTASSASPPAWPSSTRTQRTWQERALNETDPARAIAALLALVRVTGQDPFHHPRKPGDPVPGAALQRPILDALGRLDWDKLTDPQRLDMLRVHGLLFNRLGWPDRAARARLIQRFDPLFPAQGLELNADALPAACLPGSAGRRRQGAAADGRGADAGGAVRVLEVAARPGDRLVAGPARRVLRMVSRRRPATREVPACGASCDS